MLSLRYNKFPELHLFILHSLLCELKEEFAQLKRRRIGCMVYHPLQHLATGVR